MKQLNGQQLLEYTKSLFKTNEVTPEQLDYVITMLSPVSYLLKNHHVKGHGITFNIPDRDPENRASHRPWQVEIIKDTVDPDVKESSVIKSRQLGLSEVGLASLIYFCDRYSYDAVKALYTFPKHLWGIIQ